MGIVTKALDTHNSLNTDETVSPAFHCTLISQRTIIQQYDKMNQSIFNNSFLSVLDIELVPTNASRIFCNLGGRILDVA